MRNVCEKMKEKKYEGRLYSIYNASSIVGPKMLDDYIDHVGGGVAGVQPGWWCYATILLYGMKMMLRTTVCVDETRSEGRRKNKKIKRPSERRLLWCKKY